MTGFKPTALIPALTLVFLLSYVITYSQAASGFIRYEEKVDVHKLLGAQAGPALLAQIERYTSTIFRLYFTPTESLYKAYFEDRMTAQPSGSMMRQTLSMGANKNEYYTNADLMISQIDFVGQTYLVSDTIKMAQWKFGEGTRTILGYDCSLAYYTDMTNPEKPIEVTAWYTPKIRAFIGPERYNTLPGGILALDFNNGEHYWVARKIELRDLTAEEKIEAPVEKKNSKKITYNEYRVIQAEREKKIKALSGGR